MPAIHTIDDVIDTLQEIINQSIKDNSPEGYFAALYQKVTIAVKEGIQQKFFDDGPRMEQLDIIFASRYIDAYRAYKAGQPVTDSWATTFKYTTDYWPVVLQHLLVGMNAHINLDLGIAAAAVSKDKDISLLQNDFNKINQVLSGLVQDVQNNLAAVWPTLKWIMLRTQKIDGFVVDFSMQLARDGAWAFANTMAGLSDTALQTLIKERDKKVATKADIIFNKKLIPRLVFGAIRIGEKGDVAQKINNLRAIAQNSSASELINDKLS